MFRTRSLLILVSTLSALLPAAHATDHGQGSDLVDTAVAAGSFDTLATALDAAGLVEVLRSDGPFTVLAPTDEAFAKLPPELLAALLQPASRETLIEILTYHVVPGRVTGVEAIAAGQAATVQSETVRFALRDGRLSVNDANVVANDIEASNGIIHVIDTVLVPPGLDLPDPNARKIIGVYTDQIGAALAAQLELDPHRCLLISGLVDGGNAAADGLQRYDIVTEIGGRPATEKALAQAKQERAIGERVELTVLRRGQSRHVAVRVGVERH